MRNMIPAAQVKDFITQSIRATSVELIVGDKCQNACDYCYLRHLQNSSPLQPLDERLIHIYLVNALEMGLVKEYPMPIELFGGEPVQSFDYLKMLLKATKPFAQSWQIPTNCKVLQYLTITQIEDLIDTAGQVISFSLSVDSPYQDINRQQSIYGRMLGFTDRINYDYLFMLAKRYGWGFHPMLHFPTANKWFDTFKFFIENDQHPYLLEVRHPTTKEQAAIAAINIAKIVKYIDDNKLDIHRYNTTQPSITPRGLGCSALTTLTINYDGKVFFCHRLRSEAYRIANLVSKEVSVRKLVLWMRVFDYRNSAICMKCPLRNTGLCSGMCLGALAEYWGGRPILGLTIPSLCKWYYPLKVELLQRINKVWREMFLKKVKDKEQFYRILYAAYSKEDIEKMLEEVYK